jgi:hypothetical protein
MPIVRMYGTIGFFAEDGLESIHVVVNKNARTYQTVKGVKQWGCIINSKAVASMCHLIQKRTQKDQKGGTKKKQKVRQGSNKFGIAMAAPSDVITEQIYAATAPLCNWASDEQGELARLPMHIVKCRRCFTELQTYCDVPFVLMGLHELTHHTHIEKKATKEKVMRPN